MSEAKKIIVDEDWKSRVEAEREEFKRTSEGAAPASDLGNDATAAGGAAHRPPASFELLVTTLATEAMIGLGQMPHPLTQQVHADPEQARYAIDMLEMLAAKTKGNLSPAEENGLGQLLHQLRMAFVAAQTPPAAPD